MPKKKISDPTSASSNSAEVKKSDRNKGEPGSKMVKQKKHFLLTESTRYQAKGIGMCLAAVQVALFVLYQPSIIHWLWPKALTFMEEHQLGQGQFYFCYGLF